jgi:hypothetical protein
MIGPLGRIASAAHGTTKTFSFFYRAASQRLGEASKADSKLAAKPPLGFSPAV